MISWDEAVGLVENTSKYGHALMVSAVMERLAGRLGEDVQEWRLVGLLHDLDYDEVGEDMSRHGVVAADKLKGKLPKHCLYAIRAHDYRTGFKSRNKLGKALIAIDTIANLVERTKKTVEELTAVAVREEIERASVSQPWIRDNVLLCEDMELEVDEFLELCLASVKGE